MIQNKQWTWISIGTISLSAILYYYRKLINEQKNYQQNLEKFQQAYKQSTQNHQKNLSQWVDAKKITNIVNDKTKNIYSTSKQTNQQQQKLVCFFNVQPQINSSTFRLYQRQRSLFIHNQNQINSTPKVFEHQLGGHFTFKFNSDTIQANLNDFHVSSKILKQQKQDVKIFQGKNSLEPLVCRVITQMNSSSVISIFAKLYYDQKKLSWSIEPIFLTQASQLKQLVHNFYKNKIGSKIFKKMGFLLCAIAIGYFFLYKPYKSLQKKYQGKIKHPILFNQMQYFKNKDHILVRGQGSLNCQKCKTKNVQIVYQCGHLVLCLPCHQNNQQKICPLCDKVSAKFLRLYMA